MFDWDNEFWFFVRTKIHTIMSVITCVVAVVLLLVLINIDNPDVKNIENNISVEITNFQENVLLIDEKIETYLKSDPFKTSAEEVYKTYAGNKKQLNQGRPFVFSYNLNNAHEEMFGQKAMLYLSENKDFESMQTFEITNNSIEIFSLKTDTKYYYQLIVILSNESIIGKTGSFVTSKSPRILKIDGIVNVRDIGGWQTSDGKQIKQCLLYRGSELDGAVEKNYKLSDNGKSEMINVLKIKTDMDLRNPNVNKEPFDALGEKVKHEYYNAPQYASVFEPDYRKTMQKIFSDLANEQNYPIYLHCTYGRDRTGTICAILEAFLGVSKEDIKRDYEISSFSYGKLDREWFDSFVEKLDAFEGKTLQQSAENYLLSLGLTEQELKNIKNIFLGE